MGRGRGREMDERVHGRSRLHCAAGARVEGLENQRTARDRGSSESVEICPQRTRPDDECSPTRYSFSLAPAFTPLRNIPARHPPVLIFVDRHSKARWRGVKRRDSLYTEISCHARCIRTALANSLAAQVRDGEEQDGLLQWAGATSTSLRSARIRYTTSAG